MAKKKQEPAEDLSLDEFEQLVQEQVEKEFGDVLVGCDEFISSAEKKVIIPMGMALDMVTSGGIVEGSFVGITGPAKLGKTTAALSLAANCQKPQYGSRKIYYGNIEGRITPMHLKGIRGLDISNENFHIIRSRKGKILTAQENLTICAAIIRTVPNAVVIIDSISALCEAREHTGGVGTETRGGGAKLVSQFLRIVKDYVPVNNSIVVGITHLINDTGNPMKGKVERAAEAWKYYCDYQLRGIMKTAWKVNEKQIGQIVTWACNCSKLGPPGGKTQSYLRYGTGVDSLFETIQFAMASNVLKKSGTWLSPNFDAGNKSDIKFQGAEKLYQYLLEDGELAEKIRQEVLAKSGCLPVISDDSQECEDN